MCKVHCVSAFRKNLSESKDLDYGCTREAL